MASVLTFDILAKDRASAVMTKVGRSADQTGKRFDKFKTLAAGAGIAAGVALLKFGKDSVSAFQESQTAQLRLQDAFKRFPALAGTNINAFRDLNTELAKKTRFDDDAFASGQAVLAQFKLTGQQIQSLTPLLADYAVKTGKDLPQAATTLGKAFLGNTRALKELGINYKATGNLAKDQAAITDLLRQKVGGLAEQQGKTVDKGKILANQFGELEETVGSVLLPALLKLTDVGLKVVAFIERNSAVLGPLVAVFGTFVGTLLTVVKAVKLVNTVLAVMAVETTIATGGLTLIIPAIAALAAGLVIAYKKSETFRNIVNGAFRAVKTVVIGVARAIANAFLNTVEKIISFVGLLVDAFGKLPGKLGAPFRAVQDDIDNALVKIHNLQGAINAIHGKTVHIIAQTTFLGGTAAGRGGGRRQHGGPVSAGRAYLVGERRPELFVPDENGRILPRVSRVQGGMAAAGAPINITFNFPNYIGSRQELITVLSREIRIRGGDVQKAIGTG